PQRGRLIKLTPQRIIEQNGCAKEAFPAGEGGKRKLATDEVHYTDAPSRLHILKQQEFAHT
ncbi:MAG: hypothetical protein IJW70_06940, partial [Clostridia bacterium]|nr:hypothetical protein [Clostridia bacterium]